LGEDIESTEGAKLSGVWQQAGPSNDTTLESSIKGAEGAGLTT
jgi:hypothetical protein